MPLGCGGNQITQRKRTRTCKLLSSNWAALFLLPRSIVSLSYSWSIPLTYRCVFLLLPEGFFSWSVRDWARKILKCIGQDWEPVQQSINHVVFMLQAVSFFFLFEHFRYTASAETPWRIQIKTESARRCPASTLHRQSYQRISELALPCPDR